MTCLTKNYVRTAKIVKLSDALRDKQTITKPIKNRPFFDYRVPRYRWCKIRQKKGDLGAHIKPRHLCLAVRINEPHKLDLDLLCRQDIHYSLVQQLV